MRWTRQFVVLVALLTVKAAAAKTSSVLFDICRNSGISTECRCDETHPVLTLDPGDLQRIKVEQKFVVEQCNQLQINKNSFKGVYNLTTFFINNVSEVHWKSGAFERLQVLMVENVNFLNLSISSLQGAEGISNIYIKNTKIPVLPKWSLLNVRGLREFHFENVQIGKIEKDSIKLPMNQSKSDVVFQNCTIADIDEDAIQIESTINFVMNKCVVIKAANNSVHITHLNNANLTENIFKREVEINAFNIVGNNVIFENNAVESFTLNSIKNSESRRPRLLPGFDELFVHGKNNNVSCECPKETGRTNWTEDHFRDNFCLHGCSKATVSAFLERCSKSSSLNYQTWIRSICREEGFEDETTEQVSPKTDDPSTDIPDIYNSSTSKRSSGAWKLQSAGFPVFITTAIVFCYFKNCVNIF